MAKRDFVYRPDDAESAVVFGPSVYDVPLLPYERQLIATIGVTEEEYRAFTADVRRRGAVRPAAYDHIPDVQNADPVVQAVLINLAISLVLTGVAYLLTPKPRQPEASSRRELPGETGANRFTPSRGFETLAELGEYASPIPLLFGLYREGLGGGMLASPRLIWSRMFSHGALQRAKLLYVVGEQGVEQLGGIAAPQLEGVFLGNNALDPLFEDAFAFYWKEQSGDTSQRRVRDSNFLYGSRGEAHSGDPDPAIGGEVFYAPTGEETDAVGQFCHAFTPANSTQFGVFEAIANGTSFRPNYRIASMVKEGQTGFTKRAAGRARLKIAGAGFDNTEEGREAIGKKPLPERGPGASDFLDKMQDQGQRGAGRNYSPRMGIVQVAKISDGYQNPIEVGETEGFKKIVKVKSGDRAIFVISNTIVDPDIYLEEKAKSRESVDDINSSVESLQIAADDSMQVGEQFAVAGTVWKVIDRKLDRFIPAGEDAKKENQKITLECVSTDESEFNKIGIVSLSKVVQPGKDFIGDDVPDGPEAGIDETFFPITKVAFATIRNNRPAVVTEIGLKSTVFQSLNGLCAFNSLPTPSELKRLDKESVQVTNGVINSNIVRSTVFRVFVRRAGEKDESFALIPKLFLVRGNRPVAQYNFIRFALTGGQGPQELEFKFAQMPGAELRTISDSELLLDLSHSISSESNSIEFVDVTVKKIGNLTIGFSGKEVPKGKISENKEFMRNPTVVAGSGSTSYPSNVVRVGNQPAPVAGTEPTAIERKKNISNQSENFGGRLSAFAHTIIGDADNFKFPSPFGLVTQEFIESNPRKWISIQWGYERYELPTDHFARKYNQQKYSWRLLSASVFGSSGNFEKGDVIEVKRGSQSTATLGSSSAYPNSNPFKNNPDADPGDNVIKYSGFKFEITEVEDTETISGRRQAYLYELFGDATSSQFSVGESKTIERTFTSNNKTMKVELTASVRFEFPDFRGKGRVWTAPQVKVIQDSGTTQDWEKGEKFVDLETVSSANPYKTNAYAKAGFKYQVGKLDINEVPPEFKSSQKFAKQSQLSDISFYRNLVEKSNANQPEHEIVYINEMQENEIIPPSDEPSKPPMNNLVLAGLSLKATRNFTRLDQLRVWLGKGLQVERLHPDLADVYGDSNSKGASNLFTDLMYYLLTDHMGGAGALLGMTSDNPVLVDKQELINTSRFLETQKLFFNGPIVERTNLRQFIQSVAPFFLCSFVISDGKYSLKPALPAMSGGSFNTGPIQPEQFFTAGNILEDTLKIEYLGAEERRPFKAVIRYREERKNKLPQERTVIVRNVKNAEYLDKGLEVLPQEQFDLTQFCTSKDHAVKVAKYFLALRRLITHTISFSTTVEGLAIQAGSYIKVVTESSPYSGANTGTVSLTGVVASVSNLDDGMYFVDYYKGGNDDILSADMQVTNGRVEATEFHGAVFSVRNTTVSQNIYVVEQLTFSQEGTVDIVASEHPCDDEGKSLMVAAMINEDEVRIL